MISKKNRVNKDLFNKIFKEGSIIHSPIFLFKYIKNLENKGLYSFVVPKTVAKSAVKRNSLRRKGYNSLRNIGIIGGISGIFFYKKGTSGVLTTEIKESIELSLKKIK
ncbi:MAG: ribonuclease protein component [Patescibacteria group bacterium]|jgi:ribonuclease P protein component|nr:ribonuclease protein component [Patescibacteria group bacterium]